MLFQVGRLKHAKSPPLRPPPKSRRIIEKIAFKRHSLSSKHGSQLHKCSPHQGHPGSSPGPQTRIFLPWTRQQRVGATGIRKGAGSQKPGGKVCAPWLATRRHLHLFLIPRGIHEEWQALAVHFTSPLEPENRSSSISLTKMTCTQAWPNHMRKPTPLRRENKNNHKSF